VVIIDDGGPIVIRRITLPPRQRHRRLDHKGWDRAKATRRFQWYLSRQDTAGIEAVTDTLVRLDCLGDALKVCETGRRPNLKKVETLLWLWNSRGLHSIQKSLKDDLYLLTDAIRYFVPSYAGDGLTLYRGQSRRRHENGVYGIAWTSEYEVASLFSRNRDTPGIVVEVDATSDMIVVHVPDYISTPKTNPARKFDYEGEYLVDPKKLVGKVRVTAI
jgi:hypothetical protein